MESHQPLLTTSGIINPMHYYQSSEHSAVGAVGDDSTSLDSASNMVNQHFQQAMLDGDYDFVRFWSLIVKYYYWFDFSYAIYRSMIC